MSYITFKDIGTAGDLGSQVQQFASLYAIAKHNRKTIVFPESSLILGYGFKFAELLDIPITIAPEEFFEDFRDIRPNDMLEVDNNLFALEEDINYNIIHRFDSFKYWYPEYDSDIMELPWNEYHEKTAYDLKDRLLPNDKELVAIHVRRGDYLLPQHDHFCKLDLSYYTEAIQPYIQDLKKYHFVIFSNDIQWCKDNLIEGDMVTFIEPGVDYVDLILMSKCHHFVIANSSYSWWAAFKSTNKDKKVTCPINYLKSYSPWSHINGKYYPSHWIGLNNIAI